MAKATAIKCEHTQSLLHNDFDRVHKLVQYVLFASVMFVFRLLTT